MKAVASLLGDLFRGWVAILRSVGVVAAVVVSAGVVSVAIVYPLWWMAIQHRSIYSILSLAIIATAVVWFATNTVVRSRRQRAYTRVHLSKSRRVVRTASVVTIPFALYLTVVLFANNILSAAIPLSLVVSAAIGLLVASGNRRTR